MNVADGGTVPVVFVAIMVAAILLTGTGMVMLLRGNPKGGILGAVGSVFFFLPFGMLCLFGCLQCRERMINAAVMASVAPDAAAAPGSESAAAKASASNEDSPFACYGFADVRLLGGFLLMLGIGFLLYILSQRYFILMRCLTPIIAVLDCCVTGIVLICLGNQRRGRQGFSLYRNHLECVTGLWTNESVSIPYDRIRKAGSGCNRFRLYLAAADGTLKVGIPLGLLKGAERGEARETLEGRMRDLGVLSEK